ncbi:MAG: PqqD family protein [Bacteroidales bacterium]|jgi:hypothetical protein|nr:PqqD family protein [Bacteroidales bacterium]MDD4770015.1 PqqD family protein [Bacteroidales bacterium]
MKIKPTIAINDNGFLFDPGTGDSYTTNAVAREIIFLMKQGKTIEQIKVSMLERYEVESVTFEKNLIDFLAMLQHYNLCEDCNP